MVIMSAITACCISYAYYLLIKYLFYNPDEPLKNLILYYNEWYDFFIRCDMLQQIVFVITLTFITFKGMSWMIFQPKASKIKPKTVDLIKHSHASFKLT